MRSGPAFSLTSGTSQVTGRSEILKDSRQKRNERLVARKRDLAARRIQRTWRGSRARTLLRAHVLEQWLFENSKQFGTPSVNREDMFGRVLPPVLWALLRPGGDPHGGVERIWCVDNPTTIRALRGLLVLSLHTLRSSDSLVSLVTQSPGSREMFLLQRLLLVCCACIGQAACDQLIQSAALRCLSCLLTPPSDGSRPTSPNANDGWRATVLDTFFCSGCSGALCLALCRLLDEHTNTWSQERRQKAAHELAHSIVTAWAASLRNPALPQALVMQLFVRADSVAEVQCLAPTLAGKEIWPAILNAAGESVLYSATAMNQEAILRLVLALGEIGAVVCGEKKNATITPGQDLNGLDFLKVINGLLARVGEEQQVACIDLGSFSRPGLLGALLSQDGQDRIIEGIAVAWLVLLHVTDGGSRSSSPSSSLLNFLAFGPGHRALLRRLWSRAATALGLPTSAPRDATRGWDISAVNTLLLPSTNVAALISPPARACLTLMAAVHTHLLQVMDDVEFYESPNGRAVFSLDEHRAIAATCNSLIVHSTLAPVVLPGRAGPSLLIESVSALQAALFDRDSRRAFCPPRLWLAPFMASGLRGEELIQPAALRAFEALRSSSSLRALSESYPIDIRNANRSPSSETRCAALAALACHTPQCIPFAARVQLLRALIHTDRARLRVDVPPAEGGPYPVEFTVRRSLLREDGTAALLQLGSDDVKRRLCVRFVDEHGLPEAGIDMGGLQKEFFERFVAAVLDLRCGLFAEASDHGGVFPSPLAGELEGGWSALEAAGIALGKALYEGLLLNAPLAPFFVRGLQGKSVPSEELAALDPELYRSLLQLKTYDAETVAALGLDFTVESDHFGRRVSEELVAGGTGIAVTAANRLHYIHCLAHWHLSRRLGPSAEVFGRGLRKVIPAAWMRLFSPREFNELLGGDQGETDINVADLRRHTVYSGGYSEHSSAVKAFWSCLEAMSSQEKSAVLKFVTSTSRPPLGGFQHLVPTFTIHKVASSASPLAIFGGKDVDRLPTASTCTNTLKLPDFRRAGTLREKLLYAIHSGAGFDLS